MKRGAGGSIAVFARYLLFQVPGCVVAAGVLALLVRLGHVSPGLAYLLFGGWVVFEIALFPVVRIAYEPGAKMAGAEALVGARGVALEDLDPEGSVRLGPERWQAVTASDCPPLAAGTPVRVREVRQLTLVVEPADAPERVSGAKPGRPTR